MIEIEYAGRVEKGRRQGNDDRALIDRKIIKMNCASGRCRLPLLAAVCDGCGGYNGGDVAAELLLKYLNKVDASDLLQKDMLKSAFESIEQLLYKTKQIHPEWEQMCTTVAGCIIDEKKTVFFHAGDSRIYRFDGDSLLQFTKDHSAVQKMIDWGTITQEEALIHPARNVIERCVGANTEPPEFYWNATSIQPGDIYLLCSDGLWSYISNKEIKTILAENLPLQKLTDQLVEVSLNNGCDDNITVILLDLRNDCGREALTNIIRDDFVLD